MRNFLAFQQFNSAFQGFFSLPMENTSQSSIVVDYNTHPMKKASCSYSQSGPWDSHISPRDSNLLQENYQGMDSRCTKKKDLAGGSDYGPESSIMDICHGSSDDIYCTGNSDTLIENLLKLQPDLQNLKERDERPTRTGSKKNRDDDNGVLEQNIRQFHMGTPNLNGDHKIPQNVRIGETGQRMNLQEHSASFQGEENKALKTEVQRPLKSKDGAKRLMCAMENNGWGGASTLKSHKMKCESSEQQEQNERNIEKECNSVQELLLEEDKSSTRTETSCEQKVMKRSRDGASNLLMEIKDLRNEKSGQSASMQEQITLLQQELQSKTKLVEIQQKQIGDLLKAVAKSNCENARLTSELNRCMEEQGDANTLQSELVRAQEENQKLQKELSVKLTDLKNLHIMFSTLGREKEIMAAELVLKASIVGEMEEELNDLKEQNTILSNKLEAYARENTTRIRVAQVTIASLQNRNKLLAEQVLKTSEGYRALKRKSKELQEQNSGFKREIDNLKASILKQENFTNVLGSEKAALENEITWGKQQLHFLLKICECFQQETKSLVEQQFMKQDKEKSLKQEFFLLEQLVLRFKEEIACIKAESDRAINEHKQLKEEMAMLQKELLYLRTENSLLMQEKRLDENGEGSIKRLETTADVVFCKREILQAEVADINMEKSKLKLDDARDRMIQNPDDSVSSLKMIPGSEARPPMNQTMKFDVVDGLQKSKPYSSAALFIDNEKVKGLNSTVDIGGRFEYT